MSVPAGNGASVSFFPGLRHTQVAVPSGAGLPIGTMFFGPAGGGTTMAATGTDLYPFDLAFGGPASDWNDFTVFDLQPVVLGAGRNVLAWELLTVGTYVFYPMFAVRTYITAPTTALLDIDGVNVPTVRAPDRARYGVNASDHWENPVVNLSMSQLFSTWWLSVHNADLPVYVTPHLKVAFGAQMQAVASFNVVQLSPTPLSQS